MWDMSLLIVFFNTNYVFFDCSQDRLHDHRTSIELALEASLPPSDSSSTSSSDDSTDGKAHGVDLDTLAVSSLLLLLLLLLRPAVHAV